MQGASSLFSLMFQLGGSLGTAIVITLLNHKITTVSANLVKYASVYHPQFRQWWQTYQAAFMARGSDPTTAHWQALAALQGLISQQAAVIAFDYVFGTIGAVFLCVLPLVLLLRRGPTAPEDLPVA